MPITDYLPISGKIEPPRQEALVVHRTWYAVRTTASLPGLYTTVV